MPIVVWGQPVDLFEGGDEVAEESVGKSQIHIHIVTVTDDVFHSMRMMAADRTFQNSECEKPKLFYHISMMIVNKTSYRIVEINGISLR